MFKLQHALAVQAKELECDMENVLRSGQMASVSAGLAEIDRGSQTVHVAHYSFQDYLSCVKRTCMNKHLTAEASTVKTCLAYFHMIFLKKKTMAYRQKTNNFLRYWTAALSGIGWYCESQRRFYGGRGDFSLNT